MSLETLRKKLLVRLFDEHGIPPDSVRFDGAPEYHAWKLGVWEFPLRVGETQYTAMIDCNEQLASYGQVIIRRVDQAGQADNPPAASEIKKPGALSSPRLTRQ